MGLEIISLLVMRRKGKGKWRCVVEYPFCSVVCLNCGYVAGSRVGSGFLKMGCV